MTSPSTTTRAEAFIRQRARETGRIPVVMEPGCFIVPCPSCGKNVPITQEELGAIVEHDRSHCRAWRGWCGEQFFVHPTLTGVVYDGRLIGTEEFEANRGS